MKNRRLIFRLPTFCQYFCYKPFSSAKAFYFSLIPIRLMGLYFSQYTSIPNFAIRAIMQAAIILMPIPKLTKQVTTADLMYPLDKTNCIPFLNQVLYISLSGLHSEL